MLKGRKLISLFATLALVAASFVFSAPAEAKVSVYQSGDAELKLGFRVQSRLRLLGTAESDDTATYSDANTGTGRNYDFDFRRARITMGGKVNKLVSFFMQTESAGTGNSTAILDALVQLNIADTAKLVMGRFKTQFTRSRNGSGFGQMALDRPFIESQATMTSNVDGSIGGKRDQQIALWGNKDKFQYRLAIADGATTVGGKSDTLRYSGRVHYAFWDAEKGFGYKETYLGKKKILTLGAGYDSQNDVVSSGEKAEVTGNTAYTVDLTYEQTLANGGIPNFNIAYYSRSLDDNTSFSQGTGFHIAAGYVLPGGNWQPYVRYTTWDTELVGGTGSNSDTNKTNIGVNYLIKGHTAKLVFDIEAVDYKDVATNASNANKDQTIVTMQWQLDI